MEWERDFLAYLLKLQEKKPVICCGDMNVAHQEIDLKNPKTNRMNAGFTDEERACFTRTLEAGFIDTFRYFYPELEGAYSWWSYRFKAREKNAGWRIDYFITSPSLKENLEDAKIHSEIMGSDPLSGRAGSEILDHRESCMAGSGDKQILSDDFYFMRKIALCRFPLGNVLCVQKWLQTRQQTKTGGLIKCQYREIRAWL